jgi:hypothetical protein
MTELFGAVWPVIRVAIHFTFICSATPEHSERREKIGMVAADISKYKTGEGKGRDILAPDKKT